MATILVVDDHEDARSVFRAVLQDAGHTVVVAGDGDEALGLYRANPADLVLLDIFMPGKDGIQTLRELRAEFPDAKVIAISAGWLVRNLEVLDDTMDVLDHALRLGAERAIQKPIEPSFLLGAVREVLQSPRR